MILFCMLKVDLNLVLASEDATGFLDILGFLLFVKKIHLWIDTWIC